MSRRGGTGEAAMIMMRKILDLATLDLAAQLEDIARSLRTIGGELAPEPPPAAAPSLAEVEASVQRSIAKLPILGARNPAAALLIGRSIDDFTPDEVPPTRRRRGTPNKRDLGARKGANSDLDESGTSRKV
jgi:hypothetical protein